MNFYERALELREETVTHRRWLIRATWSRRSLTIGKSVKT